MLQSLGIRPALLKFRQYWGWCYDTSWTEKCRRERKRQINGEKAPVRHMFCYVSHHKKLNDEQPHPSLPIRYVKHKEPSGLSCTQAISLEVCVCFKRDFFFFKSHQDETILEGVHCESLVHLMDCLAYVPALKVPSSLLLVRNPHTLQQMGFPFNRWFQAEALF